jgi:nucleotide-binding universal stress UspA family protein
VVDEHLPETILLAADCSEESTLAVETAVYIAQRTASELHIVYVRATPDYFDDFFIGSIVDKEDLQRLTVEAQSLLEDLVKQIDVAGGVVAQAHLGVGRPDKEIVGLGEGAGCWSHSNG